MILLCVTLCDCGRKSYSVLACGMSKECRDVPRNSQSMPVMLGITEYCIICMSIAMSG